MAELIKVAIQGDQASFHEIAALNYYQYPIKLVYCQSFEEVFALLINGSVHKIFVAVSNSTHGEIEEVRQLIHATALSYEGEYSLPIQQHVIGLASTDLAKVAIVISHPVALSQCHLTIKKRFSNANLLRYHDTSAAVEYVKAAANPTMVAIGSEAAAQLHGLDILLAAVQDDAQNKTVFKSFVI